MNGFLNIFERFKAGAATEEESALVREELGKFEAIEEYLAERFEQAAQGSPIPPVSDEAEAAAGKRIARKIRVKIFCAVVAVLAVLGLAAAAAVAAVNNYYYDPNRGIEPVFRDDGQLALDMWAFTELHSPGYSLYGAEALRNAPGCYDVRFQHANVFTGEQKTSSARIVRGKNTSLESFSISGYLNLPAANAFGYREGSLLRGEDDGTVHSTPFPEVLKRQMEALKELPPSSRAAVYVTFANDMPIAEFEQHCEKWSGNLSFDYAAVVCDDGYISNTVGFSPVGGGVIFENTPEGYPFFQLIGGDADNAAAWEQHFRSLVRYLSDRPQFLESMVSINGISAGDYEEISEYIDKNGVQIYGALISGKADGVLAYLENESLLDFYVQDVRLSVLGRG